MLAPICMRNREQTQQFIGPTNLIALGHYQVTINPEIPIQVANQNQQHQLPFFITLVSISIY